MIETKELADLCLKSKKLQLTKEEVEQIIKEIDYSGNGKINYTEFLAATFDMTKVLSGKDGENKMRAIFQ